MVKPDQLTPTTCMRKRRDRRICEQILTGMIYWYLQGHKRDLFCCYICNLGLDVLQSFDYRSRQCTRAKRREAKNGYGARSSPETDLGHSTIKGSGPDTPFSLPISDYFRRCLSELSMFSFPARHPNAWYIVVLRSTSNFYEDPFSAYWPWINSC